MVDGNFEYDAIVELKFLDHVEDGDEPTEFLVWGRIIKVTPLAYTVECWSFADPDDECLRDHNTKRFTIVRSTITQAHRLRRTLT